MAMSMLDGDSRLTWSTKKSDVNIKIKSDLMMQDNAYIKFSGERSGPVGLYFFPFIVRAKNWFRSQGPHFFFNRASAMNAKYTLDLNGEAYVCETIVNIKNRTDFDYSWKINTPHTRRFTNIRPLFVESSGFERCSTNMSG